MKFVETLGRYHGQKGVFQYKRSSHGITIDSSIGNANLNPADILITNREWNAILLAIEVAHGESFGLTVGGGAGNPSTCLYDLIEQAVPNPTHNWQLNASWKSYVCAILEHEGSLDLYSGGLGQGIQARVDLTRNTKA